MRIAAPETWDIEELEIVVAALNTIRMSRQVKFKGESGALDARVIPMLKRGNRAPVRF